MHLRKKGVDRPFFVCAAENSFTVQNAIDENIFIWPEEYGITVLEETDDLEVIYLLGGG